MSLHVKAKDVPERKVVRTGVEGEGAMVVRRGYGNECSLMHAVRALSKNNFVPYDWQSVERKIFGR